MSITYVSRSTLCPTLMGCKWGNLVFDTKRLEPRVLSWQWHKSFFCGVYSWCQVWKTLLTIFRDILDSVFYCFSEAIYDIIAYLICIIQKLLKTNSKKQNAILFFEKPFKYEAIIFYFMGTLKHSCQVNSVVEYQLKSYAYWHAWTAGAECVYCMREERDVDRRVCCY